MKLCTITKIIVFCLSVLILFPQRVNNVEAISLNNDNFETKEEKVASVFSASLDAQSLFGTKNIVNFDEIKAVSLDDGLTVIVGDDIDVNAIFAMTSQEDSKYYSTTVTNYEDYSNIEEKTYIVMCMKKKERIDYNIISVTYNPDVSAEVIKKFIQYSSSPDSIDLYAKEFAVNQVLDTSSAYNSVSNDNARLSSGTVVQSLRDTNYHIDNYVTYNGGVYPVMVYAKDITYEAEYVDSQLENEERYVIKAYVNIIPGTDMDSAEANRLADLVGLYNTTYDDAIVVRACRTIFENLFPDVDYFITMSPNSSLDNANGQSISISLGVPPSVSISYDLSFNTASIVTLDTSFDSDGQCIVEFEGVLNGLDNLLYNPCLSTKPFSYTAGVYMSSGGNILYTRVATDILYYFQYPGEDSSIWSGSAREFYYVNGE